jgi:8-oxo-dGTP pyrophosphatase MutT (NUDIX family)
VSVIVEDDGRFLLVEERSSGVIVVNTPGGHIEADESPEQAAEREVLEEAGCTVLVTGLLGVYLWIHPQTRQNFLRIYYTADLLDQDLRRSLDDGIYAVHWYSRSDVERRRRDLRSPSVIRAIDDYLAGSRQPAALLEGLVPVQHNVHEVIANARLV